MTEPLPCPFCKSKPVVHNHRAPENAKAQGVVPGAWAAVECSADACRGRIVKTHRYGTVEDAVRVWNEGRDG
jgi:hypothetical protein